jgi:hypothetical protein
VLLNTTSSTQNLSINLNVLDTSNHIPTGLVTINDSTPEQNQLLTASNTLADADGLGAILYTWLANGLKVAEGNNIKFLLTMWAKQFKSQPTTLMA